MRSSPISVGERDWWYTALPEPSSTMVEKVVVFSSEGYNTRKIFLPKNQHTQRNLLNFENWCNGEVSKSLLI